VSKRVPSAPVWWKNTFFWIAGVLVLLGFWGLISGERAIRDPGQIRESGLVWIYFAGALLMLVNGALTHSQAIQAYQELGLSTEPVVEPEMRPESEASSQ